MPQKSFSKVGRRAQTVWGRAFMKLSPMLMMLDQAAPAVQTLSGMLVTFVEGIFIAPWILSILNICLKKMLVSKVIKRHQSTMTKTLSFAQEEKLQLLKKLRLKAKTYFFIFFLYWLQNSWIAKRSLVEIHNSQA